MPSYFYLGSERTDTEQHKYRSEYEVSHVEYELSRNVDHKGQAASVLMGGRIRVIIEGFGDEDLYKWVFAPSKDESGEFVITDSSNSVIEKFAFGGGRVAEYRIHFDANLSAGVATILVIDAGVIKTDNDLTFTKKR